MLSRRCNERCRLSKGLGPQQQEQPMDSWRDHHRQVVIAGMEGAFGVRVILCKQSSHPRIPHVKCCCNALLLIGTYDNLTWLLTFLHR